MRRTKVGLTTSTQKSATANTDREANVSTCHPAVDAQAVVSTYREGNEERIAEMVAMEVEEVLGLDTVVEASKVVDATEAADVMEATEGVAEVEEVEEVEEGAAVVFVEAFEVVVDGMEAAEVMEAVEAVDTVEEEVAEVAEALEGEVEELEVEIEEVAEKVVVASFLAPLPPTGSPVGWGG